MRLVFPKLLLVFGIIFATLVVISLLFYLKNSGLGQSLERVVTRIRLRNWK